MTRHIAMSFSPKEGTAAGLARSEAGHELIADRPSGVAGGSGCGFNGGELLAASLGGCFWNDLHYAAHAEDLAARVDRVAADVSLDGTPLRVAGAHITASLSGCEPALLDRIFLAACANSTIANSLIPAIPITFERLTTGDDE